MPTYHITPHTQRGGTRLTLSSERLSYITFMFQVQFFRRDKVQIIIIITKRKEKKRKKKKKKKNSTSSLYIMPPTGRHLKPVLNSLILKLSQGALRSGFSHAFCTMANHGNGCSFASAIFSQRSRIISL
jgi:hypothetical protein